MEKNLAGGLRAMHFVRAFIMSALITAMLLFMCAFLMLKTGMEEKTLGIVLAAVDALGVFVGGLYLGKKVWQTKISMGINFWHHLFSGLPGDLISYQRYEPYHTGSGEILCNNGGGGHDWGDGKLAFVR